MRMGGKVAERLASAARGLKASAGGAARRLAAGEADAVVAIAPMLAALRRRYSWPR